MSITRAVATIIHAVSPVSIFRGAAAAGAGAGVAAGAVCSAAGAGFAASSATTRAAGSKRLNSNMILIRRFIF
jgi:hypothetical protein